MNFPIPLVTIGIPTYNQEEYIKQAISSALAMNYPNLEVVVADDNSSDRTGQIAREFLHNPRFRYFRNPVNLGRTGNYRKLLYEYAKGEWYVNLDGDDLYTDSDFIRNAIEKIYETGRENVVFYQASSLIQDSMGNTKEKAFDLPSGIVVLNGKDYFLKYLQFGSIQHLSVVYDRTAAMKLDFYRSPALRSDLESLMRLALHGDIILHNLPVGVWRYHSGNETWMLDEQKLNGEIAVFDSIAKEANDFFTKEEIKNWKKAAIENLTRYFIDSRISQAPAFGNWRLFSKYGRFNLVYFKLFLKYLLRLTKPAR
jgi:glycosyltransferase involved in cell wall biosynthesis